MADKDDAQYWIKALNLVEHPGNEDGYFTEAYRDPLTVETSCKTRNIGTVAYFVQEVSPQFSDNSYLFRCESTEMLFHHYGAAVTIRIFRNGVHKDPEDIILGQNVEKGEVPFYAVPAQTWFTRLVEEKHADKTRFSVYSCSLIPGFELEDFSAETFGNLKQKS